MDTDDQKILLLEKKRQACHQTKQIIMDTLVQGSLVLTQWEIGFLFGCLDQLKESHWISKKQLGIIMNTIYPKVFTEKT